MNEIRLQDYTDKELARLRADIEIEAYRREQERLAQLTPEELEQYRQWRKERRRALRHKRQQLAE